MTIAEICQDEGRQRCPIVSGGFNDTRYSVIRDDNNFYLFKIIKSMIIIKKFPPDPYCLSELLGVFQNQRFKLSSTWYYNKESELNVRIRAENESAGLESLLSAFLSAHRFQFIIVSNSDNQQSANLQRFVLVPRLDKQDTFHPAILDKASLFVILTGLQKHGGTFCVHLDGDVNGLQMAVSIRCRQGYIPYEVDFAFGRRFCVMASDSLHWFVYMEEKHSDLLTMPYTSEEGCFLVTGFGEISQAVSNPESKTVIIGGIFNDPMARTLCFTRNNWKSSTCVWGAPGYGKTTLCLHLLLQAYRKQNINFLVVEPKQDYRRLIRIIPELTVLTTIQGFNPLVPPHNCNPYDYCEVLLDLLNLATEMPSDSPLPDYVRQVYYHAIEENNYDMGFFIKSYVELMNAMGFTGEAKNFCRAGLNRISTLFRLFVGKDFASKNYPGFDITKLLSHPTVIEIGKASTQKMVTTLTYFVIAHMRMVMQSKESDNITNILLVEEAHNVLSPMLSEKLRSDVANVIAEGRGRGISVIISEQSASRIDTSASNLCGNVFSFRVVSQADQEYVAHQLGIDADTLNDQRKQCVIARTNSMFRPESLHVDADSQILSLQPISNEELKAADGTENVPQQ